MEAQAYFLPGVQPERFVERAYGAGEDRVALRLPEATPALLTDVAARVSSARDAGLARRPIAEIVAVIDEAVARWLDPAYHLRRLAERWLPAVSGYSCQMIREGLPLLLEPFRQPGLEELLEAELGDPAVLDEAPRAQGRRARGPRLTAHVLAGNIPGVAVETLVHGLLVKSANLVKCSSRDPLFPALFAQSIAEVDAEIGASLAVLWWRGGSEELDATAAASAGAVVAYGSESSVAALRGLAGPDARFVGYGPRISFAAVAREALTAGDLGDLAAKAAWDVSFFDQQGCVSPHVIYVERQGQATPLELAEALAREMARVEKRLPRGGLAPEDAAAIQQARGRWEARRAAGQDVALFVSTDSTAWTVAYDGESSELAPGCLNRFVRIVPLDDLSELAEAVRPMSRYLQTAGVTCSGERLPPLVSRLAGAGVTRVCPIGRMQHPPASWRHDGQANLLPLLRWVDVEE